MKFTPFLASNIQIECLLGVNSNEYMSTRLISEYIFIILICIITIIIIRILTTTNSLKKKKNQLTKRSFIIATILNTYTSSILF